ncbi:hypothetical protein CRG98_035715 [Punica granatum]|uniref:Uncharacterized protein n=1 Tax=Punica granatum TaxID=22663 RepID=A0A2I0IIP9_PUNGR|nr:hypothetical protein CRG98_035715 [Punica granatum]
MASIGCLIGGWQLNRVKSRNKEQEDSLFGDGEAVVDELLHLHHDQEKLPLCPAQGKWIRARSEEEGSLTGDERESSGVLIPGEFKGRGGDDEMPTMKIETEGLNIICRKATAILDVRQVGYSSRWGLESHVA